MEVSSAAFDAAFLTARHFFDEVVRCKTISALTLPQVRTTGQGPLAGLA